MKLKVLIAASGVCAFALAGCEVNQSSSAMNQQRVDLSPALAAKPALGDALLRVTAKSGNAPVAANCSLTGSGMSASFTTPTDLRLPTYKRESVPVQVSCTHNEATMTEVRKPYDETATYIAVGVLLGGGLGGALAGSNTNNKGNYGYRNIEFAF